MSRRRGVVLFALGTLLALTGSACKDGRHPLSFTTTTTKTRVLTQSVSAPGVPAPTPFALAARATGGAVQVFPAPGSAVVATTLSNPTVEGQPLAFFVADQQGDWLNVRLPKRPNGAMGWIKASEVALAPVDHRIVISLGSRSLRVLDKTQQVLYETDVATGKPRTPTPLGRFFVDVWLPDPGAPYGKFLLSVSGFSDVLKTFGGGIGQIALHGWSDASVMGQPVSNGCIRMRNADIVHLSSLAPLGTPVEIVA